MNDKVRASAASRERLTFNYRVASVPSRRTVEAAIAADARPTFATAPTAGEARDWGYFGLLAFTAVLLFRPQDVFPGLGSMHIAELCAVIGILPMILHRFAQRLPVFRITPETVGLIFFGAVMLATAPFSIWPGGAFTVFEDYAKIVIVFVLMMNTMTSPKRIEQLTWLILVACGYIAFRACLDYVRGVNLVEGGRVAGPGDGMFSNPNDLAMNMVSLLPVAVLLIMNRHAPTLRRLVAAAIAVLMLATIVFTKSRGGFLGFAAMLVALLLLTRRIRPGFTVAILGAILVATPVIPSSFWNRMDTIVNDQQDQKQYTGSREARRIVMEEGIKVFTEFPFTGVGVGQFQNYNPPDRRERWRETHNAPIQVAAETGIFGLLAFVFLMFRAAGAAISARRAVAPPRRRRAPDPLSLAMSERDRQTLYAHATAMAAGLIGWFVCSQFASVAYSWTFYYLLALTVAAREIAETRLAAVAALTRRAPGTTAPLRHRAAGRVAPGLA